MAITARPLRVANEAFLVASMIERCPKTMMLRELVMNAIEAAQTTDTRAGAPPGEVRITPLPVDGVPKLCIWNTGKGMSATELDGICDLAASLHKQTGLDQNFGMGAKVASLPSNRHGLRFRSCRDGQVSEVVLGQRNGIYGRLPHAGPELIPGVADMTAAALAEGQLLAADWTQVVLLGQTAEQDTVTDPYAGNPAVPTDWVLHSLQHRFFAIPSHVRITLGAGVGAAQDRTVRPIAESTRLFDRSEFVHTRSGIVVHYAYAADPAGLPAAGSGMVVHSGEIYGLVEGPRWLLDAPSFGIAFGGRSCRIIVELPPGFGVRPEAYRQFLRFREGDQRQVYLNDFAALVRANMPEWLADIIASLGPARPDYLGDIAAELAELLAQLEVAPRHRAAERVRGEDEVYDAPNAPDAPAAEPPRPRTTFEVPPTIVPVRDEAQLEEHSLAGLAARYVADSHELFVNMRYPALQALQARLLGSFEAVPDRERVRVIATDVGEAVVLRSVARALVHSLAKAASGWTGEQISRAQSPEALSLAADNTDDMFGQARARAAGLLGSEADSWPADPAAAAALGRLVAKLAQAKQAIARVRVRKDAVPFMLRISEIEAGRRNYAEAANWARQAAAADPDSPWVVRQLAMLDMRQGEYAAAERRLLAGLGLANAPAGLFERLMSDLHREQRDAVAAADWAERACRAAPRDAGLALHLSYLLADIDAAEPAERAVARAMELAPEAPGPLRRMAELRLRAGNLAEAETLARRAVAVDERDPQSFATLANVLQRGERYAEASQAVQAALELGPEKSGPYLRRAADIAFRAKRYGEACQLVQAASAADPDDPWSPHLHSYIAQETGNLATATTAAAKAAAVAAASRDVFVRREAELLALSGAPQAALAKAAEAVTLGPKDANNYIVMANIQKSIGNISAAKATIDRALDVGSATSTLLLRASELSLMQRQPAAALTLAQQAVDVGSADPWAFSHLATLLESTGDVQGALVAARRAAVLGGAQPLLPADVLQDQP